MDDTKAAQTHVWADGDTPHQIKQDDRTASNRSMKRNFLAGGWREPAAAVLLMAVAVGTILRFFHLGARELSIDESLSWAEAAAPRVTDVVRVQHQLDSGKFPVYELALHGWMRVFGESEAAMRASI